MKANAFDSIESDMPAVEPVPVSPDFDLANLLKPSKNTASPENAGLDLNERGSAYSLSSSESCSKTEQDPLARAFHGQLKPQAFLQKEQPHHRFLCYLAAEGFTRGEIAAQTGFTPVHVGNVLKQEWATRMIADIIAAKGGAAVELVFKNAVLAQAEGLVALAETAKAKGQLETERKVRNDILDRVYGKAAQVIAHTNVDPSDVPDSDLINIAVGKTN